MSQKYVAHTNWEFCNNYKDSKPLLCQVLQSIQERFKTVLSQPDLKKILHEDRVKSEVICLLEALCGVAEATRTDNVTMLAQFMHPALVECVNIMGKFCKL